MSITMEYKHTTTKVFLINYHIVFCPKRRKAVLTGHIKERLENIIHEVASERHWTVMALEVMPDHVHLFISVEPNTSPNSVVKAFKGRSSRYMREEFPELLKLPSLWTRSYFISTAGNVSSDTIHRYVENQTRK
ncbi:MAG: IS200/IS605 family transposase [Methanomassiliicoccales archaeon]|nr:IS200/IS605 family transposase [Methanomassiliicoccales archaeon]TFG55313.1 MAG: IS200/IS605 family transposase [Methanomassiliicoccus sp.]